MARELTLAELFKKQTRTIEVADDKLGVSVKIEYHPWKYTARAAMSETFLEAIIESLDLIASDGNSMKIRPLTAEAILDLPIPLVAAVGRAINDDMRPPQQPDAT